MRGHHHHLTRLQTEQPGTARVHLCLRLVDAGQLSREQAVKAEVGVASQIDQERNVTVG